MSLTCPEVCVLHMCKSAYVLMHTNDCSAWPEPAGSSAAAPSTPLKKTLPDAPTVLQDSERKCQASQKEEQERWWRSSWGWGAGGCSKGWLTSSERIKPLSWFSLPVEMSFLSLRSDPKQNVWRCGKWERVWKVSELIDCCENANDNR